MITEGDASSKMKGTRG